MTRYRATLAYDGTNYQGFQRQAGDIPTIQGAVESAITRITHQTTTVIGAGRTDAGVHATGQVIAFEVDWTHADAVLLRALNAVLPDDIALQDLAPQPGFHPRFDARSRLYSYTVLIAPQPHPFWRRRAWHIWGNLDYEALHAAAALLVGEHDFATFGHPPRGTNTIRVVMRSEWQLFKEPFGQRLVYLVEATAFLQHMVRRMVGTQMDVARGLVTTADFEAAFRAGDLARAGTLAPPYGLVLECVRYA
ncbi:MAG: tRNA pseudouridine(38-40) synthase TruA [Anaerolineae bacterium]|nr:tRNA pseudouridine(38-40) synthase TruA [Anaerolineae bacterium]